MRNQVFYFLVGMLALCPIIINAQGDVDEMFRLDQTDIIEGTESDQLKVISASRTTEFLKDLPVTVYVVTRDEIQRNGYSTLVDVLKAVPGIKVSQPGSAVDGETFLIRGLYGNYYTKILIDNIPVQPSVSSGMPIGNQLPIRQAEQIEIIIGPATAIYGADAVAGVINIITKKSERPTYATADLTIGNIGYNQLNVLIGGKAGKGKHVLKYSFFGNASRRADLHVKYDMPGLYNPFLYDSTYNYLNAPYYQGDSTTPVLNRMPAHNYLMGANLSYKGLRVSYEAMFRRVHSSIGQNTANYSYTDPTNYWGEAIYRAALTYNKSWEKFSTTTYFSFLRYQLDNQSTFGLNYDLGVNGRAYQFEASDDLFFEEIIAYMPNDNLRLTGGFSFKYSGNLPGTNDLSEPFDPDQYLLFSEEKPKPDPVMGYFGLNPVVFHNLAGFLQLFYKFNDIILILGDRYDYHSIYGGSNNPRLSVLYHINKDFSVRGSYGTAFRAPATNFTYQSLAYATDSGINYRIVPNPDLQAEKLNSFELGTRFTPSKKVSVDMSLYYHKLQNQFTLSLFALDTTLYPDATNPNAISTAYVNDENSQVELVGLLINCEIRDILPAVELGIDLSVSLSKGSETLPNNLGELSDVRLVPGHFEQVNIFFSPIDNLYFSFMNIISGKTKKRFFPIEPQNMDLLGWPTEVKGYYTLDIVSRFRIDDQFQVSLNINNVFNSQYGGIDAYGGFNDLIYNPQYGRSILFGLSYSLE